MTDDVTVWTGGHKISGWTRVRITRGIERLPADFEVELTEYYTGDNSSIVIVPGSQCQILIGSDMVLTGYIDVYESSIDGDSHTILIAGRSMSEDLVDCSAEWPNGQFLSSPVIKIIQGIASKYGINVIQSVVPNAETNILPSFLFMYGETGVELIERICRYAQLLFYDLPDGSLLLTTASSTKTASGFQEGANVQSASYRVSMQRFSEYDCVYLSLVNFQDGMQSNSGQNNSINQYYSVSDPSVLRPRKKYIVTDSGDYVGQPVTKARALWEKNRRYGKSWEVSIKTDNWRDVAGNLWAPNTLADISIPSLKIFDQTWLISEVTYMMDGSSGTTAQVILNPACAFIPEPIVFQNNPLREGTGTQTNAGPSRDVNAPQNPSGQSLPMPAAVLPDQLTAAPELTKGPTANQLDKFFQNGGE